MSAVRAWLPRWDPDAGSQRVLRAIPPALFAFACGALLLAAFLAVTVPYHLWDSLAYGEWSRLIADGRFHAPGLTTSSTSGRCSTCSREDYGGCSA
jgi:hypothetical protein